MASINYNYETESESEEEYSDNEHGYSDICYSTEIAELDKREKILRDSQETDFIPRDNNLFPDLTSSDTYTKVFDSTKLLPTPETKILPSSLNDRKETLQELNSKVNGENEKEFEKTKLRNTTIGDFIKKISNSYIDIMNELLEIRDFYKIPEILIKDDRLISIGILFLVISIIFLIIN